MNISHLSFETSHVQHAIDRGEFSLLYQPKYDLYRQRITSVEALVRWNRASGEQLSPDRFIPALERSGAIVLLGKWILNEACRQLAQWKQEGLKLGLSINLSPAQCTAPLARDIAQALEFHGLQIPEVEFEVTESLFLSNDIIDFLTTLIKRGHPIAIDDFGTGHSALSSLRKFNAYSMKIDRSFFENVPENLDACMLLRSMISLGHSLGMKVVCEGIETESQLELAEMFEADEAQGYFISKPVSPVEIVRLLSPDFPSCHKVA